MSAAPASAIRLEHLGKRYRHVDALKDVTLDVHPGEVFGFLGANGAGKTTTIRILLDLVRPTGGRASIFGLDCRRDGLRARAQIGYLPGELGFYGDMTGAAILDLLGGLSGGGTHAAVRRALLDRMELATSELRRRVREYSTGMKRKLGIVQAFQSEAPLLILDEPTDGLDPLMQDAFYELLGETRRRGRTVFMSSHILPEVERICDRVGLLRHGELVFVAPVAEIRHLAARRVTIVFAEDVAPRSSWPPGCEVVELSPRAWSFDVQGPLGPLVAMVAALPVSDVDVREPHLEDVVRRYYRTPAAS